MLFWTQCIYKHNIDSISRRAVVKCTPVVNECMLLHGEVIHKSNMNGLRVMFHE